MNQARSVQERVSRLQEERAQLRAERQQLREERRAERQQARREAREARELRAERRAERQAARQAERDGQTTGDTDPVPAPQETTEPQGGTPPAPSPEPTPAPIPQTPSPEPTSAPSTGITITGSVQQTGGALEENDVALEDSTVAQDRGVAGVRIEDPGDGVTFRFDETGNGQVRGTRFEMEDGEEVAMGSQSLLLTSVGDDRGEAFGDLDFDDIGLELELDDEFTPGDLQFVELSSGPSTDAEVAAGSLASTGAATDDAASESARDQAISQMIVREQQITIELSGEQEALLNLVAGMAESGDESPLLALMSSTDGQSRDEALRTLAQSLVSQNSPDGERALQLLS